MNEDGTIKQKTIVEQLVKEIKSMITSGKYKHDDRFPTEQELVERFSVSRTSVREAVKILNYLGILESHTSRGTRVSKNHRVAEEAASWAVMLGYEKMHEVFVLGTALDTQVSIIAINRIEKENIALKPSIKDMDSITKMLLKTAEKEDLERFVLAFSNYFRVLYGMTQNTVFTALNECIDSLITQKVCQAYSETKKLSNAAELLTETWNFIKSCELMNTITSFQDYGRFAYETFHLLEPDLVDNSYTFNLRNLLETEDQQATP